MKLMLMLAVGAMAGCLLAPSHASGQSGGVLVDDFESYKAGSVPGRWQFFTSKGREFQPLGKYMAEDERFYVIQEGGNRFVRGYTKSQAQRISLGNDRGKLKWSLAEHPRLSWEWRAVRLPAGAREDKVNDSGGAVYVTFPTTDWLGRPHSIKYTYSTSLPAGREVSSGNVRVIVVSSGVDGIGGWDRVERDVAADYRQLFGKDPADRPFSITLWSDSDDTRSVAEVDFDNIRLLP